MYRENIAFKGIFTLVLFITMGISQVSVTIENIDIDAGTLDIIMTNVAGCSSCDDPLYNTKTLCESSGNNTAGGVWSFDTSKDKTTCESSAVNGVYFNGQVGGFQFQLLGVKVTGASGGSAEDLGFNVTSSESTYNETTETQTDPTAITPVNANSCVKKLMSNPDSGESDQFGRGIFLKRYYAHAECEMLRKRFVPPARPVIEDYCMPQLVNEL